MINTRDRSITHNVAKMSFDQILDLIAGVCFNITCDLHLPPSPPSHFFFLALSCSNASPNIEIRQSNKHFHALDITSLSFQSHPCRCCNSPPHPPPTPPSSPPPAPSPRPGTARIASPYIYDLYARSEYHTQCCQDEFRLNP